MLRRGSFVAAVAALLLGSAGSAPAGVTVDMSFPASSDTYEVVPLGPDQVLATSAEASHSRSVIVTTDGTVWGSGESATAPIYRNDVALPALPSGMVAWAWAQGADGHLWFTEISGFRSPERVDRIGRLDPATNAVQEFGGLTPGANADSILAAPDGNIWFVEYGTSSIGRITPSGAVTEFPLPPGVVPIRWRGQDMSIGPGGDLYFIVVGGIARMTLTGTFRGVNTGGLADFQPNAIAYGSDGNLWASECDTADYAPNTLTRVSTLTGKATRMPDGTFPYKSCPMGLVADRRGQLWLFEWNANRAGRVFFDDPLARTDDATSVGWDAADLNGSVTPRGAVTAAHFEYGPTSAYGATTPDQAIGDDDDAVEVSAHIAGLQPLTTYHYRLVASSAIGTVHGFDATVTTGPSPPPPPPPLPIDRDGDGFYAAVDCDDLSAAIHPGAVDRPGDRIDQDCNSRDADYARFAPHPNTGWKRAKHRRMTFTRLTVDKLPAGAALKLSCTGSGCPRQGYTATVAKPTERLDVARRLKGAQLRKGARVELTISRPGYVTTIVRWTAGLPPKVTTLCQPPGARKATPC